jgi:hypothetical protein
LHIFRNMRTLSFLILIVVHTFPHTRQIHHASSSSMALSSSSNTLYLLTTSLQSPISHPTVTHRAGTCTKFQTKLAVLALLSSICSATSSTVPKLFHSPPAAHRLGIHPGRTSFQRRFRLVGRAVRGESRTVGDRCTVDQMIEAQCRGGDQREHGMPFSLLPLR